MCVKSYLNVEQQRPSQKVYEMRWKYSGWKWDSQHCIVSIFCSSALNREKLKSVFYLVNELGSSNKFGGLGFLYLFFFFFKVLWKVFSL